MWNLFRSPAAHAQSAAIKLLGRTPLRSLRTVPLFYPHTRLHTGGVGVAALYDDVFRERSYEAMTPLPARPRIVDAGGHLGLASLFFVNRYPGARLTTIEPNPHLAPLLRMNLAPWAPRATVLEAALTVEPGTTRFHITRDNPLNVTGGIDNREAPTRDVVVHEVACVAARDVLAEPVDLMKLDVEGHEYALLELDLFRPEHVANMVIEFHDLGERREQFRATLARLVDQRGYRLADNHNRPVDRARLEASSGCAVLKLY